MLAEQHQVLPGCIWLQVSNIVNRGYKMPPGQVWMELQLAVLSSQMKAVEFGDSKQVTCYVFAVKDPRPGSSVAYHYGTTKGHFLHSVSLSDLPSVHLVFCFPHPTKNIRQRSQITPGPRGLAPKCTNIQAQMGKRFRLASFF